MTTLSIVVPFRDARDLTHALGSFTALAMFDLRRNPGPSLYRAGVRYHREASVGDHRRERWLVPSLVRRARRGDCEDLATYRAAELRLRGERASAFPREQPSGGFHILVRRGDGRIEDPSAKLGMRSR